MDDHRCHNNKKIHFSLTAFAHISVQVSKGNLFSNHIEMSTFTAEYDQDLYYLGGYVASEEPYPLPGDQIDYTPCICDFSRKDTLCHTAAYGNCSCRSV